MSGWQPIETAPRDGTWLLLSDGLTVVPCAYAPDVHGHLFPWLFVDDLTERETESGAVCVAANAWSDGEPTHWMPLPPAPEPSA